MSNFHSSDISGTLPTGFGAALMQNPAAREAFIRLPELQQLEIINGTQLIRSKEEMRKYVSAIPLR